MIHRKCRDKAEWQAYLIGRWQDVAERQARALAEERRHSRKLRRTLRAAHDELDKMAAVVWEQQNALDRANGKGHQ